jgi:hypothetical protein
MRSIGVIAATLAFLLPIVMCSSSTNARVALGTSDTDRRLSTCLAGQYPAIPSSRRLEDTPFRKGKMNEQALIAEAVTTETTPWADAGAIFPARRSQSHSRHLTALYSGDPACLTDPESCGAASMVCAPDPQNTGACNVCPVSLVRNLCCGSFVGPRHLDCYDCVMNAIGKCHSGC